MPNMSLKKNEMPSQEPNVRNKNFLEVALGYTEEQALDEAARCLNCKNHPCVSGCPVQVKIPEFIKKITEKDYEGAYQVIHETSSLPAVCGRVCPQETQCESKCVRGIKGEPVGIGRLERFVADWHNANVQEAPAKPAPNGHKVAVIGSGPSGLTCAGDLAKKGYDVTVFEALHLAGGVLVYGIPEFRLPKAIVQQEIDGLKKMGVDFECNMVIGKVLTIDELMGEYGYEAVFVGSGAGLPRFMGIPGESLKGVYSANEFLTRSNLMKAYLPTSKTPIRTGRKVAVVGGGNVAMDAARCSKRLGADVYVVYRRGMEELPARHEEVEHAIEEGIVFKTLNNPVKINGDEKGYVSSMTCVEMELGEPDASGRRKPVPVEGEFETLKAETVIAAIGQSVEWGGLLEGSKVETGRGGTAIADSTTFQTAQPDVFVGGDVMTGPKFVIDAIAAGKEGAISIHRFVQPGQSLTIGRRKKDYAEFDKAGARIYSYDNAPRQKVKNPSAKEQKETFRDLRGTFTEKQVLKETERCLGCGAVVLDEYRCVGCGICTTKCKFDAIKLVWVDEFVSPKVEKIAPHLIAGIAKRGSKIAIKALKDKVDKL